MEAFMWGILRMEKDKERVNGMDQMVTLLRDSTSRTSKTAGANLPGPMDRSTKESSETIYVMEKGLTNIPMAKLESLCGLMGK
jgi:hypothetical protein